jgi:outer membrane lipoprotein SlyB
MRGKSVRMVLLPVILAGGLGACANNGVQPGIVNSSYGNSTATASNYGGGQPGDTGRVVSINDVSMRGGSGGGSGNGPMVGGMLGGLGGIAIGASGGRGIGGGLVGGLLGAVGGAIAGKIFDQHSGMGGGRGIEVTVQRDDGQTVTVAQRDDGDVQLGDRVQVIQDRGGVAKVVRDNTRQPDYQNSGPANSGPAPQDYRQTRASAPPPDYSPPAPDYGQRRYAPPQSTSRTGYQGAGYQDYRSNGPRPQDDPRYGNIE